MSEKLNRARESMWIIQDIRAGCWIDQKYYILRGQKVPNAEYPSFVSTWRRAANVPMNKVADLGLPLVMDELIEMFLECDNYVDARSAFKEIPDLATLKEKAGPRKAQATFEAQVRGSGLPKNRQDQVLRIVDTEKGYQYSLLDLFGRYRLGLNQEDAFRYKEAYGGSLVKCLFNVMNTAAGVDPYLAREIERYARIKGSRMQLFDDLRDAGQDYQQNSPNVLLSVLRNHEKEELVLFDHLRSVGRKGIDFNWIASNLPESFNVIYARTAHLRSLVSRERRFLGLRV